MTATGRDPHHRVSNTPPGDPVAHGNHPASELQTRHLGVHGWTRVKTHTLQQVGPVQRAGHYVDQHLGWAGNGLRNVSNLEHLRSAVGGDDSGSHQWLFLRSENGTPLSTRGSPGRPSIRSPTILR